MSIVRRLRALEARAASRQDVAEAARQRVNDEIARRVAIVGAAMDREMGVTPRDVPPPLPPLDAETAEQYRRALGRGEFSDPRAEIERRFVAARDGCRIANDLNGGTEG